MNIFSTIAAVSTPRGKGGVAVVRISGAEAVRVADGMFQPKSGRKLSEYSARTSVFGTILDSDGTVCDEGLATVFRAPASFTGEDVVEISCHGGLAVTEAVYLSALAHGATPASAGEFTKRSFIAGKLSLTEAEAVGRLIDADTREKMALSSGALRGNVSRELSRISDSLLGTMTALYAAIDYPEEGVGDEGEREIHSTVCRALSDVKKLLDSYKVGRAISDGVRCVLCGAPNAGKSSVFNRIVGADSAIVTDIAGTTRDILRETVSFGGITLRLSDTAGIRDSSDVVESVGIERALSEVEGGEIVIWVIDASVPLTSEDRSLAPRLAALACPKIAVLNKSDLGFALSEADMQLVSASSSRVIPLSAKSGEIGELDAALREIYGSGAVDLSSDAIIWDVRQRDILMRAYSALSAADDALTLGDPLDAICTLVEQALASLNETDGRGIGEEIVAEVFKRFCVGK